MPERLPLVPRLRELDEALEERGMPAAARARVQARLEHEAHRRASLAGFRLRWLPALTFAAGAALVLLVVGLRFSGHASSGNDALASRVMGMFTVQGEGCRHHQSADETVLDGTCRLVSSAMAVHSWERVRLSHERSPDQDVVQDVVRIRRGAAMFDITTVLPGEAPTRIAVSHGTIEVLGTRFTIEQTAHGGHVDLFEGRIRFIALDGSSTEIAPGQRYTWGQTVAALTLTPPPSVADAVDSAPSDARSPASGSMESTTDANLEKAQRFEPDLVAEAVEAGEAAEAGEVAEVAEAAGSRDAAPVSPRAESRPSVGRRPARKPATHSAPEARPTPSGSSDEAAAIIEEVARLRAQGRYADAASVLRRANKARRWDRRTAQVLSYELGEIIERHLDDTAAACKHWARHQARFRGGRYARAITAAQERLDCGTTTR